MRAKDWNQLGIAADTDDALDLSRQSLPAAYSRPPRIRMFTQAEPDPHGLQHWPLQFFNFAVAPPWRPSLRPWR